jgi:hypothetical protein
VKLYCTVQGDVEVRIDTRPERYGPTSHRQITGEKAHCARKIPEEPAHTCPLNVESGSGWPCLEQTHASGYWSSMRQDAHR